MPRYLVSAQVVKLSWLEHVDATTRRAWGKIITLDNISHRDILPKICKICLIATVYRIIALYGRLRCDLLFHNTWKPDVKQHQLRLLKAIVIDFP